MNLDRLIIDGHNLLHKVPELARLQQDDPLAARHRLVRMIEPVAPQFAENTIVVFDGREAGADTALSSERFEVLFAPAHLTADTVIERLVQRVERPGRTLVVTSDLAEHRTVVSAGAQSMSCEEFLSHCEQRKKRAPKPRTQCPPGKTPRLGDFFPDGL